MKKKKLTSADLYSYSDIAEVLKTGISHDDFLSLKLPHSSMPISAICRVLPYTVKTSDNQLLRPLIIPVQEGCSLLPRARTSSGYVLHVSEYQLCDSERLHILTEYHKRKTDEITRLLTACIDIQDEHTHPAPPPLFCSKNLRIAPVWNEHPNGGEPGYMICSIGADGNRSCRVSSGIWSSFESAQLAIDKRCFPTLEEGLHASCQLNIKCFPAGTLDTSIEVPPEAHPREYFG